MRDLDTRADTTRAKYAVVDEDLARAQARIRDLEAALEAAHRKLGTPDVDDAASALARDALEIGRAHV